MPSENRPYNSRTHAPHGTPMKGETVQDLDSGEYGVVSRRGVNAGGTVFVRFPSTPGEVMYTYRAALKVWKAFPGPASAIGLAPLE